MRLPNVSKSSIGTFLRCPADWYYRYVLGLTEIEEKEYFRIGTRWHSMLEDRNNGIDMETVASNLRAKYGADATPNWSEWAILNYGMIAYDWYRQSDEYEVIATEKRFEIPVTVEGTEINIVGVMDRIERGPDNRLFVREYKTRGGDLDDDYWASLARSTQTTMYVWAGREMGLDIAGVLYDVYRKPGIRPKLLTQSESAMFLSSPDYMGATFDVQTGNTDDLGRPSFVMVEGEEAEIKPGAKGFQVRETPLMFGARMVNEIYSNPPKYFGLKEVCPTSTDITMFHQNVRGIMQAMIRLATYLDGLYHNEVSCDSDLCKHPHSSLIAGLVPNGFKSRNKKEQTA